MLHLELWWSFGGVLLEQARSAGMWAAQPRLVSKHAHGSRNNKRGKGKAARDGKCGKTMRELAELVSK
jgi:hypothetical protein